MKEGKKTYLNKNVLTAAQERISLLFDHFEHIVVSISGGKDSRDLYDLVQQEAIRRGRTFHVFFLDQEAEYQATIDIIWELMNGEAVIPHWYQVPIKMTNASSLQVDFLNAWGPGEEWMREKDPLAIHAIQGKYPERFYKFFEWFEEQWDKSKTCFLVGLRAEESLNRFRAVIKNPGWNGQNWTTQKGKSGVKAYPLYDWTFEDVWHHIAVNNLSYNRVYDFMHWRGYRIQDVRVSYLGHENSLKSLESLHEFEPETYTKLLKRMPGVHVAARYIKEDSVYSATKLPPAFSTWKAYRDFLLETTPSLHIDRFRTRFAKQGDEESICRQQVRQLLINDWEQNIPVVKSKTTVEDKLKRLKEIL
ncbi:phosphoadenosine phosphosulfate reductase family protein [Paenibacillus sp. NRS-1783]|uniref:phosphoadenosine phosphosulfate reductase domain-containing protein n=1 Tax=Paenibacillus sp. NRS-1783 TaxID=3233907 RepID=UPI003D2B3002